MPKPSKILTHESINPNIKKTKYAVRGELAIRAEKIIDELSKGNPLNYSFNAVVNCNIGNPQQLKQKPITFFHQVRIFFMKNDLMSNVFIYSNYF